MNDYQLPLDCPSCKSARLFFTPERNDVVCTGCGKRALQLNQIIATRFRRFPDQEAVEIMNRHQHRGYDDWRVTEDFTEVYSEQEQREFPGSFMYLWEARAIALRYVISVERGWIRDTEAIKLIDATDAPEA